MNVPRKNVEVSHSGITYYFMYSEFEERFGLFNHAVEILDRMSDEVPEQDKQRAYEVFATKVANLMGVTRTRPIYEKALENFKGKTFVLFGLRYAKLEKMLGEIDRARQIFNYLAPMVDPEIDHYLFWKTWEEFELAVGNEDTFKEMMRVRRTVESKYSILPPTVEKVEMQLEKEQKELVEEQGVNERYDSALESHGAPIEV